MVAISRNDACLILFTGSHPSSDRFPLTIKGLFLRSTAAAHLSLVNTPHRLQGFVLMEKQHLQKWHKFFLLAASPWCQHFIRKYPSGITQSILPNSRVLPQQGRRKENILCKMQAQASLGISGMQLNFL